MKIVKKLKPTYLKNLGKGRFVGEDYRCNNCGYVWSGGRDFPSPTFPCRCANSDDGKHDWERC